MHQIIKFDGMSTSQYYIISSNKKNLFYIGLFTILAIFIFVRPDNLPLLLAVLLFSIFCCSILLITFYLLRKADDIIILDKNEIIHIFRDRRDGTKEEINLKANNVKAVIIENLSYTYAVGSRHSLYLLDNKQGKNYIFKNILWIYKNVNEKALKLFSAQIKVPLYKEFYVYDGNTNKLLKTTTLHNKSLEDDVNR